MNTSLEYARELVLYPSYEELKALSHIEREEIRNERDGLKMPLSFFDRLRISSVVHRDESEEWERLYSDIHRIDEANKEEATETELIGYVGVDTGQIAFADPTYIDKVIEAGDAITESEGWNERASNNERYLAVPDSTTQVQNAIYGAVVDTGIGDGFYPVLVTTVDMGTWGKRVSSIEIVFLPDED